MKTTFWMVIAGGVLGVGWILLLVPLLVIAPEGQGDKEEMLAYKADSAFERGSGNTSPVTLAFVGDILLDRHIRKMAQRDGYPALVSSMKEAFAEFDFAFGNLEGPVTSRASISEGSEVGSPQNFAFTFSPESLSLLSSLGIGAVSIGNNHILDLGREGLKETKQHLREARIAFVGDPSSPQNRGREFTVGGESFAIVYFNQFLGDTEEQVASYLSERDTERIPYIVFAHWGEEYERAPTETQRSLARAFVDAGARMVIGAHSHVIGEKEIYRGVPIYYSLGNFVFDQYFSEEVSCGLLLGVDISNGDIQKIEERTVRMRVDGTTQFSEECDAFLP